MSEQYQTDTPIVQEAVVDVKTARYAPIHILEKTKELATSNIGMALLTFFIIAGLFILRQINHRHSDTNAAALTAWTTPANTISQPLSGVDAGAKPIAVAENGQITAPHFEDSQAAMTKLTRKVTDLSQQLDITNQHLQAISTQLDALYQNQQSFNKAQAAAKAYQLLGTHLDANTNQYKADIEYNNQVVSKFAGESFGQWIVKKVDAQGAVIQERNS